MFEGFWFSDAGKWSSANVFYEFVDFCKRLFVERPFLVVRKSLLGKRNFHNADSSMECTAPDSICEIERSKCSRFASVERRYSVSSSTSRTEISIFRPKNIVLSEFKKFKLSSSQFNENVLCIKPPQKINAIFGNSKMTLLIVRNYIRKYGKSPHYFFGHGKIA